MTMTERHNLWQWFVWTRSNFF